MEWMKRRLPKPSELAPLLRFKKPVANPVRRRLANAPRLTSERPRRIEQVLSVVQIQDRIPPPLRTPARWQPNGDASIGPEIKA